MVRKQIEMLVKIQDKDQALDQLKGQILAGPERIKESQEEIERLERDLESDKIRIQECRKVQREYESTVEDCAGHIRKSKAKLLTIKNNKEYQAVLKEIEDTEGANAEKEDKILACMEELESLKQAFQDKENNLSAVKDRFEQEAKAIQDEVHQAQDAFSEEERQREGVAKTIDPKILAKYELLKTGGGGLAVALVQNATCSGCHMSIPPQMYNELQRRDSLTFCPNCERIIYWQDRDVAEEKHVSG